MSTNINPGDEGSGIIRSVDMRIIAVGIPANLFESKSNFVNVYS
jgi:hypothetical protein